MQSTVQARPRRFFRGATWSEEAGAVRSVAVSPATQYVLQAGLTLVGIALLAYVLLYVGRRLNQLPSRGPLELVGRLPLEGRRAIYLVRVGERVLVLAATDQRMDKIAELDAVALDDSTSVKRGAFAELLSASSKLSRRAAAPSTSPTAAMPQVDEPPGHGGDP